MSDLAHEHPALVEALRVAVPLHMADLAGMHPEMLTQVAQSVAGPVGSKGDMLMFPAQSAAGRQSAVEAFGALARGIAALTLLTGDVEVFGLRFTHPDPPKGHA